MSHVRPFRCSRPRWGTPGGGGGTRYHAFQVLLVHKTWTRTESVYPVYWPMSMSCCWGRGLVYITANISGGHLNPAVSVAAVATGYLPAAKGAVYVVAQILGAVLASLVQVGPSQTVFSVRGNSAVFTGQFSQYSFHSTVFTVRGNSAVSPYTFHSKRQLRSFTVQFSQ